MNVPCESYAKVSTLVTYGNPMIRGGRELLDDVPIRRPSRQRHELTSWQRFDLPVDLSKIDVLVVSEERSFVSVVVDPLFENVSGPAQTGDCVVS